MKADKRFLVLLLAACLMLLPFLGLTDYHTKGEPRESIVAYSMLESGNWILPENNGGDMAYKPPFFHWMITLFSVVGGAVSEYSSRLPSAVALIVMVVVGYLFFARRRGKEEALLMGLITLTNFEVHRAGFACRVDMVLTACIVLALYALYCWWERGLKGIPWLAALLMGCATLTKGPVGFLLPCMVGGLFLWMREGNFWRAFWKMALAGGISCVLPALWYVAAYQQGGEEFMALVMEENLHRFVGKMSYASHENPISYNFISVIAGYVPYTLLALLALPLVKFARPKFDLKAWWERTKEYFRTMDPARLFALLSILVIFVFYCIPKSKRSVYLLPIYPFIALFLAEWMLSMYRNRNRALKWFGALMAGLNLLLLAVFAVVRMGWIPESLFGGRHGAENWAMVQALEQASIPFWGWIVILLPAALALWMVVRVLRSGDYRRILVTTIASVALLFVALDGVYQPTVLNVKSDKQMAADVAEFVPEGPIYSYVSADMLRFYVVNFYTDNRVLLFEREQPESGYLLIGRKDAEQFLPTQQEHYTFEQVYESTKRGCDVKDIIRLYRFNLK